MPLPGLLKIISNNTKFTFEVFPNVVWQIQNLRIPNAPVPLYDHRDTKIPFLGPIIEGFAKLTGITTDALFGLCGSSYVILSIPQCLNLLKSCMVYNV